MSRELNSRQEAEAAACSLTDYVNMIGREPDAFVQCILRSHRTLQQNVMRLFMELCKAWSKEQFYDARNEGTIQLAGRIIDAVGDEIYLPYI